MIKACRGISRIDLSLFPHSWKSQYEMLGRVLGSITRDSIGLRFDPPVIIITDPSTILFEK